MIGRAILTRDEKNGVKENRAIAMGGCARRRNEAAFALRRDVPGLTRWPFAAAQLALIVSAVAFPFRPASADAPVAMYIFPAGGQRGTEVKFRVGGLNLHDSCRFQMSGQGIDASSKIQHTKTAWFEGPVVPLPDSQQAEDYPQDMAGSVMISASAAVGPRPWRLWTAQGAAPSRTFIIGTLPEFVEDEMDGDPIPVRVSLPLTINGRIFPREDVDVWSFEAKAGQTIVCTVLTTMLGSPFDARLLVRDAQGRRIAESTEASPPGTDAALQFTAPADGTYSVAIHDAKFGGLQHYVYRLTVSTGPFVERAYPLGGRRGTAPRFWLSGTNLPVASMEIPLPAAARSRFMTGLGAAENSSNLFKLEADDLAEWLENEPNDNAEQVQPFETPAVFNGRIDRPGDIDIWKLSGMKGDTLEFDLRAA